MLVIKKIAIVGTVGLPSNYGGFETLCEYLVRDLSNQFEITVFCSEKSYSEHPTSYNGAKLEYVNLRANGIQSIFYDIYSILKAYRSVDTILILGVSGCVILPFIRIFSTKKIIVNIDGVEWKRNKWHFFAKWFLKVSEKLAVKYSDCVVTDNKVIQSHVSRSYKAHSKLIEYGGDHVSKQELSSSILNKYPFLRKPYAFSVCRIEPENNICMILESFVTQRKLQIIIVGNWLNSSYGRQLFEKFHYKKGISLIDPIYDQTILNSIRANCDLYIHGHSAGGTNPSLVEAMHLELPIFAFGVNYNIETTEGKANYFSNSYELTDLVMDSNSDDLKRNACNMHEIASRRYVWSSISRKYASLF